MSVQYFNKQELTKILSRIKYHENKILNILDAGSPDYVFYVNRYKKLFAEKKSIEHGREFIEHMFWYLTVANRTAYVLQYKEEPKLFADSPDDYEILKQYVCTKSELVSDLKHFNYNIHTNDGNKFIEEKWYKPFEIIINWLQD